MQLDPNYIVGLIDGEGYFSVQARKRLLVDGYYAHAVDFVFGVQLQEKDKEILYTLKNFFGCGNVSFKPSQKKNWSNCYEYRVTSATDIRDKIVPFFESHLLKFPSKKKSFDGFCELLELAKARKHLSNKGLAMVKSRALLLH